MQMFAAIDWTNPRPSIGVSFTFFQQEYYFLAV